MGFGDLVGRKFVENLKKKKFLNCFWCLVFYKFDKLVYICNVSIYKVEVRLEV